MRRQYKYFAISGYRPFGNDYDVLRQDGEHEEIFVAAQGWQPSHASERRGFGQWEIDERRARIIIDWNTSNRFLPLDRPFRYFALTDAEHPVDEPLAVVRRWSEGPDEYEDVLVSMTEWAPSTPPAEDTVEAVPIDAADVDRFAATLQERETGRPFYHYVAIVDQDPPIVMRERPATGGSELFTESLRWEPGTAAGRRKAINADAVFAYNHAMAERVREAEPHRHYVVVTDDHPDVTDPAALLRQHICATCLPSDEVYRENGRWVPTNEVIAIRAGERPGKVVPITTAAADALRETWRPRRVLEREPVSRPLFRYYAVVSDARPVDDPLTVVRVRGDTGESYTPALRWEQATTTGERVEISAPAVLRFEETQFRRVFGGAEFRYYAAVNALHPDPEDPAAVLRKVIDELNVWITEVHGAGHQWTYVEQFDKRVLVRVTAEKAALLREICDYRTALPWYYRGTVGSQSETEDVNRFRNNFGFLHRENLRNGGWDKAGHAVEFPRRNTTDHHFEHPLDIETARIIEAHGNHHPPRPPEPERLYTYCAVIDEYGLKPAPVRRLIRTWTEGKYQREQEFTAYNRSWSGSWIREDVSRGEKDYEIIGISEAEALRVQETLVEREDRERTVLRSKVYYAITDAEHTLYNPLALIRTWPDKDVEMVEEYTRGTGWGAWQERRNRPPGDAVELTEASRHRAEQRAFWRIRSTEDSGGTS
ncbi:MAG: hypothetical protein QOF58_8420 [Pseudonocardiales bacterium]|nr:hypothetical protein [Pseudonocardiales bacterium]